MLTTSDVSKNESAELMRAYLCDFFVEFQYCREDADVLISTYDCIINTPEACELLFHSCKLYEADYCCDYNEIYQDAASIAKLTGCQEFTVDLLVFICLSKHLKELYVEKGINLEFYKKSMLDLKYKLEECKVVYGIVGTFVVKWFPGFFRLTRFGMGRLQFEVISFNATYEKNGIALSPEDKVINLHIPRSGEPITEQACNEAYLCAKEFFKNEIKFDPCPFVCSSYLLYPENENFIPKHTNTYRFLKSYDVFSSNVDKNRDNLWRLFDTQEKNIDRLPTDTSMRRAFVEHLKNGGKIGTGRGILFI